jgi:hypothetical protein
MWYAVFCVGEDSPEAIFSSWFDAQHWMAENVTYYYILVETNDISQWK